MPDSGRRIGAFRLEKPLESAEGTELWHASRVDAGSPGPSSVWVRCLCDPDDTRALGRLREEHEVLSVLADVRIPSVLDFNASLGLLVLEDTPGTRLDVVLQAAGRGELVMDPATAVDIVLEVAQGLRHAHSVGRAQGKIVHGHLSPSRVVLGPGGEVRILGFGVLPEDLDPRCMPPELTHGTGRDERTDQWQIGALLYELLTGKPVYQGVFSEVWQAATRGDLTAQLDQLEFEQPALTQVLRKILAAQPSGRYQVESTFLRALLTASHSVSGASRRESLGVEAASLKSVLNSDVIEVTPSRKSRGGSGPVRGSSAALFFDSGDLGEQSEYELAEQNATSADTLGKAWVNLPNQESTPLPDLFTRPMPASLPVRGAAGGAAPMGQRAALSRLRSPMDPPDPPAILAARTAAVAQKAAEVRTTRQLSKGRVDDLRTILGGGQELAFPQQGLAASGELSVARGEQEEVQPSPGSIPGGDTVQASLEERSVSSHSLSEDSLLGMTLRRPHMLDPTGQFSGRKRVLIQHEWEEEPPTDPGEQLVGEMLDDHPNGLRGGEDSEMSLDDPFFLRRDVLPASPELSASSVPMMGSERIEWGLFLAASMVTCGTLWALVSFG